MDANRISVARVLELGVPLTWQEAVAVTQEVAIVSVVNTTMKGHASKVDADACFLTRRGDVELPVAAAHRTPRRRAAVPSGAARGSRNTRGPRSTRLRTGGEEPGRRACALLPTESPYGDRRTRPTGADGRSGVLDRRGTSAHAHPNPDGVGRARRTTRDTVTVSDSTALPNLTKLIGCAARLPAGPSRWHNQKRRRGGRRRASI